MTATIFRVTFGPRPTVVRESPSDTAQRAEAALQETLDLCERSGVPRAMALIQANAAARTVALGFDARGAVSRAHDRAVRGSNPQPPHAA